MKGWIDRVFALDAAYGFIKGSDQGDVPVGLLATKAALVINTGNTPLEREREAFGDPLERMWRDCMTSAPSPDMARPGASKVAIKEPGIAGWSRRRAVTALAFPRSLRCEKTQCKFLWLHLSY